MAKIVKETVVLEFSKLVKDGHSDSVQVTDEVAQTLETVAQELVGEGVIVEATVVRE